MQRSEVKHTTEQIWGKVSNVLCLESPVNLNTTMTRKKIWQRSRRGFKHTWKGAELMGCKVRDIRVMRTGEGEGRTHWERPTRRQKWGRQQTTSTRGTQHKRTDWNQAERTGWLTHYKTYLCVHIIWLVIRSGRQYTTAGLRRTGTCSHDCQSKISD